LHVAIGEYLKERQRLRLRLAYLRRPSCGVSGPPLSPSNLVRATAAG
jgi:hypothetical protein